jgi:AcrR family transcriptional regulator
MTATPPTPQTVPPAATGPCGPAAERRPGRPRDARADDAIMAAAVEVLADRGPSGFTVDEVASRAGCGKATIYRRWESRASLLLDTAHRMGLEPDLVDTGSVTDDLVVTMSQLATKLRDTPAGRIIPAVVAEAAVNPDMRTVLGRFVCDRRNRPREIVRRAIDRGELAPGTDVEMILDLLGGVIFYKVLVACEEPDEAFITSSVEHILGGFRTD